MGNHRNNNHEYNFNEYFAETEFNDIEYDLDDEAFFEMFEPKAERRKDNRKIDAKERLHESWENRDLAEKLDHYYYRSGD